MLKSSVNVYKVCIVFQSSPGLVKMDIYWVKKIYEFARIPLPKGLSVRVIPSEMLVSPHEVYTFKIEIITDRSLQPGKYVLCINISGCIGKERSWLTLEVR